MTRVATAFEECIENASTGQGKARQNCGEMRLALRVSAAALPLRRAGNCFALSLPTPCPSWPRDYIDTDRIAASKTRASSRQAKQDIEQHILGRRLNGELRQQRNRGRKGDGGEGMVKLAGL